jgi:hypothetical protein
MMAGLAQSFIQKLIRGVLCLVRKTASMYRKESVCFFQAKFLVAFYGVKSNCQQLLVICKKTQEFAKKNA